MIGPFPINRCNHFTGQEKQLCPWQDCNTISTISTTSKCRYILIIGYYENTTKDGHDILKTFPCWNLLSLMPIYSFKCCNHYMKKIILCPGNDCNTIWFSTWETLIYRGTPRSLEILVTTNINCRSRESTKNSRLK